MKMIGIRKWRALLEILSGGNEEDGDRLRGMRPLHMHIVYSSVF